ncbi:secretin N-terminal domain-containing protein [Shewanella waksmanii]|uniref:secretin N-terminal domain-containing protein n=1 Tax=Shewanella waksmanii TaxID=213783 RepID=UPI00068714C4|nr:secretin N-terminal domain-containing protein [Shewanella waksmanii]
MKQPMLVIKPNRKALSLCIVAALSGCASTDEPVEGSLDDPRFRVPDSYLEGSGTDKKQSDAAENPNNEFQQDRKLVEPLKSLPSNQVSFAGSEKLAEAFPSDEMVKVAAEEMQLQDFVHYTFGQLLGANYVIDESIKSDGAPVTLNIAEPVSKRRLFELVNTLLEQREANIVFENDIYFLQKLPAGSAKKVTTGIGRTPESVPYTKGEVLQVVPLLYGVKISIERTLNQIIDARITADYEQSTIFVRGTRTEVIRALELVNLLDAPANRGKNIGLINLTFIDIGDFISDITALLENEGVPISAVKPDNKNAVLVPITQIGAVAAFTSDEIILNRIRYWAQILDKPKAGTGLRYYTYQPQYARASDIGESLSSLLGAKASTDTAAAQKRDSSASASTSNIRKVTDSTGRAPTASKSKVGASSDSMSFVVDERSNQLIFYTTGTEYQNILPLIDQLDILPKQVMLDIVIAEVKLEGTFQYGVEWALSQGDVSLGGKLGTGGEGFKFSLEGVDGSLNVDFFKKNQFVNVLSNPSLLVRDGVSASIVVGDDISIIGETTDDPTGGNGNKTTASAYRKTGIDVSVTPTVNAQGVVIMEITQSISNATESSGSGGNPNISERRLQTEVVADSGSTIILGGLISENIDQQSDETPWVADIPLLGNLFKGQKELSSRVELVMLVTPRVVDRSDKWGEIKNSFAQGFQNLYIPGSQQAEDSKPTTVAIEE